MKGFIQVTDIKPKIVPKAEKKISGCNTCGMYLHCNYPKTPVVGEGKSGIMLVFDYPTAIENRKREMLIDPDYQYILSMFTSVGYNIKKDLFITHAVECRPVDDKPTPEAIAGCSNRLIERIKTYRPSKVIICSSTAWQVLYHNISSGRFSFTNFNKFVGFSIPDQNLETMVCVLPDYKETLKILYTRHKRSVERRTKEIESGKDLKPIPPIEGHIWEDTFYQNTDDFKIRHNFTQRYLIKFTNHRLRFKANNLRKETKVIMDEQEAISILRYLMTVKEFAFDTETTGLKPYADGHKIHIWGFSDGKQSWGFPHLNTVKFNRTLQQLLSSSIPKYGANIKFEQNWVKKTMGFEIQNWDFDINIGAHILDHREGITSLKFQSFVRIGEAGYDNSIDPYLTAENGNAFNRIIECDLFDLCEYCANDAHFTYHIAKQMKDELTDDMWIGYNLFHEGQLALAEIEYRGMMIDPAVLYDNNKKLEKLIYDYDEEVKETKEAKMWLQIKRYPLNVSSPKDLSELFFTMLKYDVFKWTPKGTPAVDADTMEHLSETYGNELATILMKRNKLVKLKDTFLKGFREEMYNGEVHPSFALNTVASFRSSSMNPNFQNLSKHDKEARMYVKGCIVPRKGFKIIEYDYSSLEAFMGCNYHKDPVMEKYLLDENTDMHRDSASDIFMCDTDDVTKDMRQIGKTFNFAMQYGIAWFNLAKNLWNTQLSKEHKDKLFNKGIETFEQFSNHIKEQYDNYWNNRFGVLSEWRNNTWKEYIDKGEYKSYTGFTYNSILTKNQICNFPIQGSGFHCLLKGFIGIVNECKKMKLRSGVVAEIHDSCVMEVADDELEIVNKIVYTCMIKTVKEEYPWMKMPLYVEADVYPMNWAESSESFTVEEVHE